MCLLVVTASELWLGWVGLVWGVLVFSKLWETKSNGMLYLHFLVCIVAFVNTSLVPAVRV